MSIGESKLPRNHVEINLSNNDGGPWVKIDGVKIVVELRSLQFSGDENEVPRVTLTMLPASLSVTSQWASVE